MLKWDSSYSVHVKEFDDQHKRLIDYINLLETSTRDNDPKELTGKILKSLVVYTIDHFKREEEYFRQFKYEKTEEHVGEHQKLVKKLNEYVSLFETENKFDAGSFIDFLTTWLVNHLTGPDKEYVNCFVDNGLT